MGVKPPSLDPTDAVTEKVIAVFNHDTITPLMVSDVLDRSKIDVRKLGVKTTVVTVTLPSGFVIVKSSSCVNPDNYDEEVGKRLCLEEVYAKVYELLGFLLQTAVGGV
jgi:hypothetical protein